MTGESFPLVSVIIPCYNQAHFLPQAIESALGQDYPCKEIIVVDDGSTDATAGVAASYAGVHCTRQPNLGVSAARNAGVEASTGDRIVFLDADDRLVPGALRIGVQAIARHRRCGLAYGRCRHIAADGSVKPDAAYEGISTDCYRELLIRNYIWMPAMVMHRRSVLTRVGTFDPALDAVADYELYLRIARLYPLCYHGRLVAEYRLHAASMSRDAALMLQGVLTVMRAQRAFVRGLPSLERAYELGLRSWREFYGEQLVEEIRVLLRTPSNWTEAVRRLGPLLRYHPRGALRHGGKKLHLVVSGTHAPQTSSRAGARASS
jgi:glycosyltransferase involved in cell wall biosynthesis